MPANLDQNTISDLISGLDASRKKAESGRLHRLLANPVKYIYAMWHNHFLYKYLNRTSKVEARLFTGDPIYVHLPSSTDIYLTGCKSHRSELKLSRFLLHHLNPGDAFIDIGAHCGFYSLVAARLVGGGGMSTLLNPQNHPLNY